MRKLTFFLFYLILTSCCDEVPPSVFDCKRVNYDSTSRFERLIPDSDTQSMYFGTNIIRIGYDRVFSHLEGKDCPINSPGDIVCENGDFYIYNLHPFIIKLWMTYQFRDGKRVKGDEFIIKPLDSLVLLNDSLICEKNSPGFRFFY